MNLEATTALLVGMAVLLPFLNTIKRIKPKEVLTRTGVRMQTPDELNITAFRLSQAGVKISAEWFAGLKAALAGGVIIVSVLLALISSPQALYLLLLAPLLFFAPEVWLNEHITKRKVKIQIDIVDFNAALGAALEGGASLLRGLESASKNVGGPLGEEIAMALQDHRFGRNLSDSLYIMANRIGLEEVQNVVRTLVNVYEYGAPLTENLRALTEYLSDRQIKSVETQLGKLSIKLIAVSAFFIFIPVCIIVLYPAISTLNTTM